MRIKNIAILHYSCPPVVGGVEEIVRQQASLLHRYFHPVKVLAGLGSHFTQEFEIEINPLLSSRNKQTLLLQNDVIKNWTSIQQLADQIFNYLKKSLFEFDVLIAHNVLSMHYNLPLTLAIHKLADHNSVKVIAWNHDSPFFYRNYPKYLSTEPWQILKKYNPNISYVTISTSREHEFKELYGNNAQLTVIPNGIDPIHFFRLDPVTVRLIQEKNLFSADLLIVQPSRLHPRKNIELSIRVLKSICDKGINAYLLLTGAYDPHERKTLQYYYKLRDLAKSLNVADKLIIVAEYTFESGEKLSADRVTMRDLYQIADFLFLPSKQEGFGIPLLEAGMIKLPIFCSDIPPFKSIAENDVNYFSLKDTPNTIAQRILNHLNQMETHRIYRKVIRDYVWDNIYKNMLKPFVENL